MSLSRTAAAKPSTNHSKVDKKEKKKDKKDKKPTSSAAVMAALPAKTTTSSSPIKRDLPPPTSPAPSAQKSRPSVAPVASTSASSQAARAAASASAPRGSASSPAATSGGPASERDELLERMQMEHHLDVLDATTDILDPAANAAARKEIKRQDDIVIEYLRNQRIMMEEAGVGGNNHSYNELVCTLRKHMVILNEHEVAFIKEAVNVIKAFQHFNGRLVASNGSFTKLLEVLKHSNQDSASKLRQQGEQMIQSCIESLNAAGLRYLPALFDSVVEAYKEHLALSEQAIGYSSKLILAASSLIEDGKRIKQSLTATGCKNQIDESIARIKEIIDSEQKFQQECQDYVKKEYVAIEQCQSKLRELAATMFPAKLVDFTSPDDQILRNIEIISGKLSPLAIILLHCFNYLIKPSFMQSDNKNSNLSANSASIPATAQAALFTANYHGSNQRNQTTSSPAPPTLRK